MKMNAETLLILLTQWAKATGRTLTIDSVEELLVFCDSIGIRLDVCD